MVNNHVVKIPTKIGEIEVCIDLDLRKHYIACESMVLILNAERDNRLTLYTNAAYFLKAIEDIVSEFLLTVRSTKVVQEANAMIPIWTMVIDGHLILE